MEEEQSLSVSCVFAWDSFICLLVVCGSVERSKSGSFLQLNMIIDGYGQFSKFKKYMKATLLLTIPQKDKLPREED